ncbi:FxSxx-COOH system tetratricopeptide repeat protein [Streptomyces sp. NPDC094149]|uniref:FxSxx-COOH system tetratricopeptide repeat protein n=1 Tax=Streptomyces sp. NPDC094149 TaxID=3155079 RepID=UPI00331BF87D
MSGIPRERAPGAEEPAQSAEPRSAPRTPSPWGEEAPDWRELADALWLAALWDRTGRAVPGGRGPAQAPDLGPDEPPFLESPEPPETLAPTSDTPDATDRATATSPDPEGLGRLYLGAPLLPAEQPPAPGRGARAARLARALHGLGRRVPSRGALLLDEELTAERMAVDTLWMPSFRPALDTAFDLVLLIDSGPTMAIWRKETAALQDAAEHSGAFRTVRTVQVDVPETGPPVLRSGPMGTTRNLGEIIDARGDRLFLVVTDGLGRGWATPAADTLLDRLGGAGPTAVVQLLPPHLRHRSSLSPQAMRLRARGFGVTNKGLDFQDPLSGPDPIRPLARIDHDTLAVPVLSLRSGSLAAWANLVVGEPGWRELPVVLTGTLHTGSPAPGLRPPRRPQAAAAVRRFFTLATPTARRLATQLAAIPFEFDLIQQLRDRAMPQASAEHLAEILIGGLIDWDHEGTRNPEFAAGVREALLATTTRTQLARVVDILSDLPAAGDHGLALRAALRDPAGAALPGPSAVGWRRAELVVMRALSGPYAVRARRIETAAYADRFEARAAMADEASPMTSTSASALGAPTLGPAPETEPDTGPQPPRSPAFLQNVPPRNKRFVGRTAQLQALASYLAEHGRVCVLPHPLTADSSVGVSELALEYVYRHRHDYDLICWIPAGEGLLLSSFASLAAQLGLLPTGGGQLTVESAVPVLLGALRTRASYDRWLLVLDGAGPVDRVLPHLPAHGSGQVLVTSCDLSWAQVAPPVTLDAFEREESIALLRKHAPDLREADANVLAEVLGDLPAAVEQAGAWHRASKMPAETYLDLLHRRVPPVDVSDLPPGSRVLHAVAWDIALEALRDLDPVARGLLEICAHLGAEPIPLALLRDAGPERGSCPSPSDPTAPAHALRRLERLSLATIDLDADTLRLPRPLQALLLASLSLEERERMREVAHDRLAAAWPSSDANPEEWQTHRSLLPHLFASRAETSTNPRVRAVVHAAVRFLERCGDAPGALTLGRQARAAWVVTPGAEHGDPGGEQRDLVRITMTCAHLLRQTGRIAESVPLAEDALRQSRKPGVPSEDLVGSLCGLAVARRHQGLFQEAQKLSEEALTLARNEFGAENVYTLLAAHSLGVDLRLCGRFDQALSVDTENARCHHLIYGRDAHDTLASLDAVSIGLRECGDYPGARDAQEDLYRRVRSVFGEEHHLTWRIADTLAVCRRSDGAPDEAAGLSAAAMWGFEGRFGPDHPSTLAATVHAAIDRRLAGDPESSHRMVRQAATRLASVLGEDHLHTLTAQTEVATALRALGRLDEARALEDEVACRLEATVGPRHPTALIVALGRANTAYAQLDFGRAHDLNQATLPLLTEIAGERHPLTAACAANLALAHRGLGQGSQADALERVAVEKFTAVLRPDHPWLLSARQRRRIECQVACVPL